MNKYGFKNANQYVMGNMQHTYAASVEKDTEDNVKAAKSFLKGLALTVITVGAFLGFFAQMGAF